jgi:hypothetical protein
MAVLKEVKQEGERRGGGYRGSVYKLCKSSFDQHAGAAS